MELSYGFLDWFKRGHFFYLFSFLLNFKPIDPFLYETFTNSKNITDEQYSHDIYPISAYTNLVFSFLILLVISFCNLNIFLTFSGLGNVGYAAILWRCESVAPLQLAQAIYGYLLATEFVYYAYIYICFDNFHFFLRSTSHYFCVVLLSKSISSLLGHFCILEGWLNFKELAFISFILSIHTFIFITDQLPQMYELKDPPPTSSQKIAWFKSKFKENFSDIQILKLSLWTAFLSCGYYQATSNVHLLWKNGEISYNGCVEAIITLAAFLVLLLLGYSRANDQHDDRVIMLPLFLQGALLIAVAYTNIPSVTILNIFFYIMYGLTYYMTLFLLSFIIASKLRDRQSFGMVFAFIGFITSILNLIFACVFSNLTSETIFNFLIYAFYHFAILGIIFVFYCVPICYQLFIKR